MRRIVLLAGGHFVNDIYGTALTSLVPFLIPALGLSLPMVGLAVAIYQISSSVVQPILGHLADRFGTRLFSFLGTAAVALGTAALGFAPDYGALLVLVAAAGLGTASFHPQSAAMVNALCGGRRGAIMSAYLAAGNVGYALGPMMIVPVVTAFGLQATALLVVPGLISAVLLGLYAPRNWLQRRDRSHPPVWRVIGGNRRPLTLLLGAATARALATMSLATFLPLLLHSRGYPPSVWAALVSVFLVAGAVSGVFAGYLSDRIGRRWVMGGSLVLAVPFLFATLRVEGIALWVAIALAGAALMGSFPVMTVRAQEMLPQNVGMASGLMLGFTMGVGGLGMGPAGLLAERMGIEELLSWIIFLPLLGGLLALSLPDRPKVKLT